MKTVRFYNHHEGFSKEQDWNFSDDLANYYIEKELAYDVANPPKKTNKKDEKTNDK